MIFGINFHRCICPKIGFEFLSFSPVCPVSINVSSCRLKLNDVQISPPVLLSGRVWSFSRSSRGDKFRPLPPQKNIPTESHSFCYDLVSNRFPQNLKIDLIDGLIWLYSLLCSGICDNWSFLPSSYLLRPHHSIWKSLLSPKMRLFVTNLFFSSFFFLSRVMKWFDGISFRRTISAKYVSISI